MNKYDIIGDIHGYSTELELLLEKLGYRQGAHPEGRKVIFVGDYIDRGPRIKDTLDIVKGMVDAGHAIALMGNHEYNAICFHTKGKNGHALRWHNNKNRGQHEQTLLQFIDDKEGLKTYIDWFKTLPLFLELDGLRAVHATWDADQIDYLKTRLVNNCLTDKLLEESATKGTALFDAVEMTLKGKETALPEGYSFLDKDGHKRHHMRVKWWRNPVGESYKSMSVIEGITIKDQPFITSDTNYYQESEPPVFFGHYWLKGEPNIYRGNICCLDYSVAKEGHLVAYRYDGETQLSNDKLIYVKCNTPKPKPLTMEQSIAILPPDAQAVAEYEINGAGFSGSDAYIAKARAHSEKKKKEQEMKASRSTDNEKPVGTDDIIKEVPARRKIQKVRLGDVAEIFYGRPARRDDFITHSNVLYLTGKNIGTKGELIFKKPRFVLEDFSPNRRVQKNDILMITTHMIDKVADSAVYQLPCDAVAGNGLTIIRPSSDNIANIIYSERFRLKVLSIGSMTNMRRIRIQDLRDFEIEIIVNENE